MLQPNDVHPDDFIRKFIEHLLKWKNIINFGTIKSNNIHFGVKIPFVF